MIIQNRTLYSQGSFSFKNEKKELNVKTEIPEFSGIKLNKNSYNFACHPLKYFDG